MIRKTLITATLAAALVFSPLTSAPARADNDVGKILLGAIALGVVVNAIEKKRDRDQAEEQSQHVDRGRHQPPYGERPRHGQRPPVEVPGRFRPRNRVLPAQCEFDVRTWDGRTDVLGARCMERAGVRVNRLPNRCEFSIPSPRGPRTVFGKRCLRHEGYTVEARRR